jgi:hypothetical protein
MAQHDAATIRKPRTDDRPLWDVVLGLYGYPAVLLAHRLKLFPLLAEKARPAPSLTADLFQTKCGIRTSTILNRGTLRASSLPIRICRFGYLLIVLKVVIRNARKGAQRWLLSFRSKR